jgi:hypothetical protein
MLNTLKSEPLEEPAYHYFSPEDLALMRHAYHTACAERPTAVQTPAQRLTLAKAILVVFDSLLPETAVVAAAWHLTE